MVLGIRCKTRFIEGSKNPGTLWIGSNHGASIVKVEPLD
jgi:hypothetical protein